jgi:outer membrane lipoprotein SlyB
MKTILTCTVLALGIAISTGAADAKGCIKGALVGGAAGHYANHHGFLGAAAGCVIGHHMANKKAKENGQQ